MITGSSAVAHDRRFKISRRHARGQSLVEFAMVLPVLLLLIGGAVQFGVIFAAQNSLTQIARDTARWASTQAYAPCSKAATDSPSQLLARADEIATASALFGYTSGMWNSGNFNNTATDPAYADNSSLPASPPNGEGVEVVWSWGGVSGGVCPPLDNVLAASVAIRVTHTVPVVLPGLQYLPSIGTLTSTSIFRMEPPRQAPSP